MKKYYSLLLGFVLLVNSNSTFAQITIAQARASAIGSSVTVSGIVTNGSELGNIRYFEDSTAGIAAYGSTISSVKKGDSIKVTGTLKDYKGLLEIDPVSSFTVLSSGKTIIPKIITPIQMGESTEGQLVQINNAVFDASCTNFVTGTYNFTSNGETAKIYVSSASSLNGSLIAAGEITLIGISSQFTYSNPASDGYQLIPRDINDLGSNTAINFTSCLLQSNITSTSFDLAWGTDTTGSTNIKYGLTPLFELGQINQGNSTKTHSVSLTGLTPATFYYIVAYSVFAPDTVSSSVKLYSTASSSSGDIKVYFNHSVDTSVATGTNAVHLKNTFSDTIAAYINLAQTSLDLSVYNNDNSKIATAINNAYNRGVNVRYITESSTANLILNDLNNNIKILERTTGNGIMHNKFVIVDANSANGSFVITGSTNFTSNNLISDYNNMIIVQDQAVAKAFELEFEEMWGDTGLSPNTSKSKFGENKTDNTPHQFIVGGKAFEVYFSPSDHTTTAIINAIQTVDYGLEFAILSFTKNELGTAVKDADAKFGVTARGIIESTNDTGEEFTFLQTNGVNVVSHLSIPYDIHHKYAIIDQLQPASDPMVVTGSHNWSSSAESNNDENTIIVHDATVANLYYQEFNQRFKDITDTVSVNDISNNPALHIQLFPNPNEGTFSVSFNMNYISEILFQIMDITGREVFTNYSTCNIGKNNFSFKNIKLAPGLYLLKAASTENNVIEKFIVN